MAAKDKLVLNFSFFKLLFIIFFWFGIITVNTFDLSGYELYTNCEPCPMCLSAIYWSHINKVYYANTRDDAHNIDFLDPIIYSELQKDNKEKTISMIQMMREEGLKAFETWDKKIDKIKY